MESTKDIVKKESTRRGLYVTLPVQGIDLFEETLRLRKILPSGCKKLDDLLEGGLFTQELTEVFGPPGVGKTQMALSITANLIQQMDFHVIYYDTSGSFLAERLMEIVQSNMDTFSQQAMRIILARVSCCKLFNAFDLLSELELLKEKLSVEHYSFCFNLKLLVVDCISAVITPILGGKKQHGHAIMSRIGQLLKEIAYEFGISVLVINGAVGNFDAGKLSKSDKLKPSLGSSWLSVPHIRLFFNFTSAESLQRVVKVSKHPRLPTQLTTTIFIAKNGICSENNTKSEDA